MLDFLPAFDSPTAERMECTAQENATRIAVYRRLALALLTKTSTELRQAAAEAPEAFLSNTERLRGAIEWHEAQLQLLRTAEARILAALSDTFPEAVEETESGEREIPIRLDAVIDQEAPHG